MPDQADSRGGFDLRKTIVTREFDLRASELVSDAIAQQVWDPAATEHELHEIAREVEKRSRAKLTPLPDVAIEAEGEQLFEVDGSHRAPARDALVYAGNPGLYHEEQSAIWIALQGRVRHYMGWILQQRDLARPHSRTPAPASDLNVAEDWREREHLRPIKLLDQGLPRSQRWADSAPIVINAAPTTGPAVPQPRDVDLADQTPAASASMHRPRDVTDPAHEQERRAELRCNWLTEKLAGRPYKHITDGDGAPSDNTLRRYRSGAKSNQDGTIRSQLAKIFKCDVKDVPR